jgi:hypothetical protein
VVNLNLIGLSAEVRIGTVPLQHPSPEGDEVVEARPLQGEAPADSI